MTLPPCLPLSTFSFLLLAIFSILPLTHLFSQLQFRSSSCSLMLPLSWRFPSIASFSFPLLGPAPAWLGVLLFLLEVLINFLIIIGLLVVGTFALVFVWSEHSLTPA